MPSGEVSHFSVFPAWTSKLSLYRPSTRSGNVSLTRVPICHLPLEVGDSNQVERHATDIALDLVGRGPGQSPRLGHDYAARGGKLQEVGDGPGLVDVDAIRDGRSTVGLDVERMAQGPGPVAQEDRKS